MLVKNEESAWQKASASLDATAKIYGYRVDSVHSETFKFLGGLNRNKKELNLKEDNNEENQEEVEEIKKKDKIKKGINTLETNIKKLNLSKYDIDSEVDPLFSVMTSKFNESSARGLLLNTIPLDENINYILESKKVETENPLFEKYNDNKEDDDKSRSNNDTDSLSNELSDDNGSRKLKEALTLEKNLKKKEDNADENDNESRVIPITCAPDFELTRDGIKKVLKNFIKDNNIDEFIRLQICPELTIFRESRKLNTEDANLTFINTFKDEIEHADKKRQNDFEDNNSVIDEEDQVVEEEPYEEINDATSQNSNNELNGDNNENNQNAENTDPNLSNFKPKNNESSFNVFRYEDLIERAGHFGTGNTKNMPEFMNFAKNFGKLEKSNFFNKGSILGLNNKKEGGGKKKKEEKNIVFSEKYEVNINDLFSDIKSKVLNKANDYSNDYEKRRKAKCFFNYDKFSQFKLYTITGKSIFSMDIDNEIDLLQQEKNLGEEKEEKDIFEAQDIDNQNENDIIGFEKNNEYDIFYQDEKKAEKNFGKLYRKFDIRSLKKKIWSSYEDIKEERIDFKNIVVNMSKNMNEEEIFSISTPTCFVCMLHLCNEKNLFIEQQNMNTFYIEKDPNGLKSDRASRKKKRKSSDDSDDSDSKDMDIDK